MKLPPFLRRSLRRKVSALVAATTLAALAVTSVALIIYNVRDYHDTKLAEVRTQAEIVGRASAPALAFNDPEEAARDLAMLDARPDVLQAALYAQDGTRFASFDRGGEAAGLPDHVGQVHPGIAGGRLTLVFPIVEDGQRVGTVALLANYGLGERLAPYILILGLVMAAALVAALLLSSWLQRAVTEPILSVAAAARGVVERRDLSLRAGKTTDDEIGMLADAMNHMLADLEREIDERRGAEDALRAVDRRKDEFLATLAHELRNPLAPIRNALHLLQSTSDPNVATEARAIIDRQVRQMVRLVDDLIDVSRITTGKLALRRENVELRAVAVSALEAVDPIMRARGHRLTVELPPPGLAINADATRLAQVFLNVLSNAAKYTDPGGHIDFSLTIRDGEMLGRISDNGVGIAPEMLDTIFGMFAQVDRSLERSASGLGVGLSLSRKLMELHGGTVRARSEGAGRGSEFIIRMPAGGASASRRDLEGPAGPAAAHFSGGDPGTRPCVLVVDDNQDFASSLGHMLQGLGYDVHVEYDGLAGLAAAETYHPTIAFLDIGMPKLNGYDLARRLRALPATGASILIAVTGWGQESDRLRAKEAGFDHHIVKPLEFERLETLLRRLG